MTTLCSVANWIRQRQLRTPSRNSLCLQASCVAGGNPALPNDLLDEMSHFVDQALRDAPASCNSPTTSIAALASASTAGPVSSADVQPSADDREAGAEGLCQQMPDQASNQLQERDEQGPKRSSDRLGNSESVRSIGSKKVNKPAWAMTADAALDAEQQEEEDLLAFAGGLEFDKYINQQEDAKLRTALQVGSYRWSLPESLVIARLCAWDAEQPAYNARCVHTSCWLHKQAAMTAGVGHVLDEVPLCMQRMFAHLVSAGCVGHAHSTRVRQ